VTFDVVVAVTLKPVVNDPQGLVVRSGLHQLGFNDVGDVRIGKYIELSVDADDETAARERVTQMCERLLRNPVIEDYDIELVRSAQPAT
jgi:phosphoribosylformylglycinamidine synthase